MTMIPPTTLPTSSMGAPPGSSGTKREAEVPLPQLAAGQPKRDDEVADGDHSVGDSMSTEVVEAMMAEALAD